MDKVLLTGASGFIGSHIAELFSQENIQVKCLVRPSSDITFLKTLNVEIVVGDITNIQSIRNELIGVDFVIHAAGKSSDWGNYKDFYETNVLGTMNILKACKSENIENLIITGSISSYGEEDCRKIKNEDSPYNSHYHYFLNKVFPSSMNFYRDTKAILTQQACEYAAENNLNLTIIEPAWVYGEREFSTGFYAYLKAVQAGMSFAPGSKCNKFHVIYARDLAEAYLLAFQKNLPGINRIIVGNPAAEKLDLIYSLFRKSANLKSPKLIPKSFIYPIGFWMEIIAIVLKKKEPPILTRSRVNMMYDSFEFSVDKARRILGFEAKTSLQNGVYRTVEWYRQNGLLHNQAQEKKMIKHKLYGFHKSLFILKLKMNVAYYYFKKYMQDKNLREFILILKRLNFFIGKISHNKFAQIGKNIRLDMYVPGFPSKAFYTGCNKFAVFNEKLPCIVALVSVTSACTYHCEHCYQRFDIGKDVDLDKLIAAVKYLQDSGIAFFNIEGGEPFLVFDRLLALCRQIDDRSEIWVNTTGYGITKEKLIELKKTNLTVIMFSLHSYKMEDVNAFMGDKNAWQNIVNAIELCHETGIPVAFNSCLPLADFRNGNFEKLMQQAKDFGGFLIQIIKPKPSGGWLESGVEEYSAEDFALIKEKVNMYNLNREFADFPAISAQIIEEDPEMFGCTAGGTDRIYINSKGDVQPCEFLNTSFGNIVEEDFEVIFKRMREVFEIPQSCITCEKYARDIYKLYHDNKLDKLPLPKELSKQIFDKMKRNNPTRFYEKVEKEIK